MVNIESYKVLAKEVHKTYDTGKVKVSALRGVDLRVREGEMVAVMGPSGCGKTTLLNCLSGLDGVDSGVIEIGGSDLAKMSDNLKTRYRATKMGYVFQAYNLLPVLTALENVELPLLVSGTKARIARERARATLDMVGLADRTGHLPSELSGGEQQRVTISRALVNEPEIIWGDEPTGNLDSENSKDIMDLLCTLNSKNRQTFILVTHSEVVAERAHRIVRMEDGLIIDAGNATSRSSLRIEY
jgi:putative ABC transport system ATP-binding protein